ncbi:hypothetical protein CLV88_12114 [Shimia abyssi]|uniref:Uncharacterized protein n=2 Tax=Shimia abyssi TaxID=1662395 RepID=A0A2P8F5W4_9RHOB|nr:hypothetical protein CLV88_12114 [Shimia abyssi]
MVTGLTGVMIVGLVVVVSLIVIQFRDTGPVLPENLDLPEGAVAYSVTVAEDWVGVTTKEGRLLVFDRITGALRQEIDLSH